MVCQDTITMVSLIIHIFDSRGESGFEYAYQYPGMNKVMQAAGRVIRTIQDKGIIALLDDRFLRPEYVALFPREWGTYTVVNRYNVSQAVDGFWRRIKEQAQAEDQEQTEGRG